MKLYQNSHKIIIYARLGQLSSLHLSYWYSLCFHDFVVQKKKREKKREKRENEIRFLNGKQLETVACKIWAFTLVVILNKIHTYRS